MDAQVPDWKQASPKENELNQALRERNTGKVRALIDLMTVDEELLLMQRYANAVSVRRLGYNDHGPVHARIVTYNALKVLRLLHQQGVSTSLEEEGIGTFEDASVAVALGAFLHDVGMGVARDAHEWHSVQLAGGVVQRMLRALYPDDMEKHVVLRALVHEIIVGHMGNVRVHSVEAGILLVADGTDMAHGRSRIPQLIERDPVVGDMHRFSASAIRRVEIVPGEIKPVRVSVSMENETGLFQVEQVLMEKVKASSITQHFEVCALVNESPPRFYLR